MMGAMLSPFRRRNNAQVAFPLKTDSSSKTNEKRSNKRRWRRSKPSAYFGERSSIVLVISDECMVFKPMKLKNALKKGLSFQHKEVLHNAI
ncbi:hypothetical protein CMT52_14750 [Elizabethkingia anophelis]|nr:hypothetical protein [Elizabethkingia anophelis]